MSSRSQVANGGGPRKSANGRSCKAAAGKRVRAMKPRLCRPTRARRKAAAARAAAGRTPRAPGEYSGAAPRRCSAVSPATQRSGTLSASKRRCTVGKFSRPNSTTPASSQIPEGRSKRGALRPRVRMWPPTTVALSNTVTSCAGSSIQAVMSPLAPAPTIAMRKRRSTRQEDGQDDIRPESPWSALPGGKERYWYRSLRLDADTRGVLSAQRGSALQAQPPRSAARTTGADEPPVPPRRLD